jgi:osmoprotectant transport system substrate-binding protein
VLTTLAACGSTTPDRTAGALDDDAITIGSFNFSESELLAQLYGQALESRGFTVHFEPGRGPRELLLPALEQGLVELLPEYAGTALQFVSLGSVTPSPDPATTHRALQQALVSGPVGGAIEALDAAPAENANRFVVTTATAARYGLAKVSDLRAVAGTLRFGGSAECPRRPFCLDGLRRTYQIGFQEVLTLDAGGPRTQAALEDGYVDVGVLFSTNPVLDDGDLVALDDDRDLEPAENVTPLLHRAVLERWGEPLRAALDGVSEQLTTAELRDLNAQVATSADPAAVAGAWLAAKGLA